MSAAPDALRLARQTRFWKAALVAVVLANTAVSVLLLYEVARIAAR